MNFFSRRRREYDYDDNDGRGTHNHGHGMTGQQPFHSGNNNGFQQHNGVGPNTPGHHQEGWTNNSSLGHNNGQHNTGFMPGTTNGPHNPPADGGAFGHTTAGNNPITGNGNVGHNTLGHNTGTHQDTTLPQVPGVSHNDHHHTNRSSTAVGANDGYNNNNGYNQGMKGNHHDHHHNGYNQYDDKHHRSRSRSRNRNRRSGGGGFLQRRNKHATNTNKRQRSRAHKEPFSIENGTFNRRPKFGQWLKFVWLDLFTMACLGAVGLGIYNADPAPSRSFPVTFSQGSGDVVFPTIAYPLRNEIVPIWAAALMASLIPILIILLMQIRVKSFWDVNNAVLGLLYSLIAAAVFQVFLKWLIGGLRPHFLAVCDPDPALINAARGSGVVQGEQGNGYEGLFFDRRVCRGKRSAVNDALESFPSGHSTASFAGFVFLYFYLNAKLKVFGNYHPAFWKLIATYAPILGATLIAGAMTIDEYHHWYDVVAGGIIGTVMATSSYRMVYASIWDFRFNHIPLTRHTPFSFGAGAAGAGGFEAAVFTRRAGWGTEEAFGGAPFDAAYHLRDQVNGFNTQVHDHDHSHKHGGLGHKHSNDHETKHGLGHDHGHNDTYRNGDVEHHAGTTEPIINKHNGHSGQRTLDPTVPDDRVEGVHEHGSGGVTTNRDGDLEHSDGYVSGTGSNRYRQHRKSTERKAVNNPI